MSPFNPYDVCVDGTIRPPWDVIPAGTDLNGWWMNPNWAWEIATGSEDIERSPKNRCGGPGRPPCTSFPTKFNTSAACPCNCHLAGAPSSACPLTCSADSSPFIIPNVPCSVAGGDLCGAAAGHINWGVATVCGQISYSDWNDKDSDFTFMMTMPAGPSPASASIRCAEGGARVAATRVVEFSSEETVDNFRAVPWWNQFWEADDERRRELVGDRRGVVLGLYNLDGSHPKLVTELHPVWALALAVPKAGSQDDMWAVFFRKKMTQGYCGSNREILNVPRVHLALPWRAGASSVVHNSGADRTVATENTTYSVSIHNHAKLLIVTVNFADGAGGDDEPWFAGEIHLRWDVAASLAAVDAPPQPRLQTFENVLDEKISGEQRETLERSRLAKLRSKSPQRTAPARLVPGAEPLQPAISDPTTAFTETPADEDEERQKSEASRDALEREFPSSLQEPPKQ